MNPKLYIRKCGKNWTLTIGHGYMQWTTGIWCFHVSTLHEEDFHYSLDVCLDFVKDVFKLTNAQLPDDVLVEYEFLNELWDGAAPQFRGKNPRFRYGHNEEKCLRCNSSEASWNPTERGWYCEKCFGPKVTAQTLLDELPEKDDKVKSK